MGSRYISVELKFLKPLDLYLTERPFQIFINLPSHAKDRRTTNLEYEDVTVPIYNIRGKEASFNLDRNGFAYVKHVTSLQQFDDRACIEDIYLREVEKLIRENVTDVDRIFIFDWRLRKNAPEVEEGLIDLNDPMNFLRPAIHVHIGKPDHHSKATIYPLTEWKDQSPAAVLKRVQLQLDDPNYLLRGRVRVINVWRPLVPEVTDWPLAVCDGSTVDFGDLVEADHVRRSYTGSTMYLNYNAENAPKFYYMSDQGIDDVLIFKNFDSDYSVPARFAPHASFRHPCKPTKPIPRVSIEVRALVFTYPKGSGPITIAGETGIR